MSKRRFISGEKHHWWPQSVSSRWTNEDGLIRRIDPTGKVVRSTPANTACISDGHNIKVGSPWRSTFEDQFDKPDSIFPDVVRFFETIADRHTDRTADADGFCAHDIKEAQLEDLVECLISLAVRSPKFRNQSINAAQSVRSELTRNEYRILSAANIQQTYVGLKRNLTGRGKLMLVLSKDREFIFGDGFYNNVKVGAMRTSNTRILVPLTPALAVYYIAPIKCIEEPRIVTLSADAHLVCLLNDTVQIYSKDCLYFRDEKPELTDYFRKRAHLEYANGDPIEELAQSIPGIRA